MNMMNTYFPMNTEGEKSPYSSLLDHLLDIKPVFDYPLESGAGFTLYLESLKKLIMEWI